MLAPTTAGGATIIACRPPFPSYLGSKSEMSSGNMRGTLQVIRGDLRCEESVECWDWWISDSNPLMPVPLQF